MLFVSLLIHKGIEAFSVGLQIARSNTERTKMVIITIFIYSLTTPLGSIAGVLLQVSISSSANPSRRTILAKNKSCCVQKGSKAFFVVMLSYERIG